MKVRQMLDITLRLTNEVRITADIDKMGDILGYMLLSYACTHRKREFTQESRDAILPDVKQKLEEALGQEGVVITPDTNLSLIVEHLVNNGIDSWYSGKESIKAWGFVKK